jgi:hypothetical protein
LEFGGSGGREVWLGRSCAGINGLQEKGCRWRLGMSPLGGGDGAATIVIAATGISDDKLSSF